MKKLIAIAASLLVSATAVAMTYYTGGWAELSSRSMDRYNGLKCIATNAGTVSSTCGIQPNGNPWCRTWLLQYELYPDGKIWALNKHFTTMTVQGVRYGRTVQRFGYSGGALPVNYATCEVQSQPNGQGPFAAILEIR